MGEMNLNYEETLSYIHSIPKFVRPLGNADLARLLDALKNPQKPGRFIHIAGTNGKGSTAAMTASVLKEQGYKTGLYTSPFIEVFNERIQINGENIPDSDLCDIAARIRTAMEENGLNVSEFAFITAMAFLYFKEQDCDFAVIETGMGGRLDATNIIETPLVSVITSIGLDHTQYLGDTIEEIAEEKCGIIKKCGKVVSHSNDAVRDIIENAAERMGAELVFVTADDADGYEISLNGKYQRHNAAGVIGTVEMLRKSGVEISEQALRNGLKNTKWPARFEFVRDNVIIDGGHNIDGIRALKASLAALNKPYVIVIAMMRDKAVGDCIREISDGAECVIACELNMERCESAENIAKYADNVICERDSKKAIDIALGTVKKGRVVCVCGSLYLAGEARTYIRSI